MECQHHQCGDGGTQFRSVYCAEAGENNYIMYDDERCGGIRKPHVRLISLFVYTWNLMLHLNLDLIVNIFLKTIVQLLFNCIRYWYFEI